MGIADSFDTRVTTEADYRWTVSACRLDSEEISQQLADGLAQGYMELHVPPAILQAWEQKRDGGADHTSERLEALEVYIRAGFGIPKEPGKPPKDHIEGLVAEHLWYFLTVENGSTAGLVRVEPPSFKATDPGGDSLAIHRLRGALLFRLWELKKCTGGTVSGTISRAYEQLESKALEYLARYSMIGQETSLDSDLKELYANLVQLWVDADASAAPGVGVGTSVAQLPQKAFSTFPKRFPQFAGAERILGSLLAIEDLSAFTEEVRKAIWKGL